MAREKKSRARKLSRKTVARRAAATAEARVACWEDDPGDPKSQPPLAPIAVDAPSQSAPPLPFKISGKAPAPSGYALGTPEFRYYAAAAALARTASFWGSLVSSGTHWQVGKVLPVELDSGVDLNAFYTRGGFGDAPGLHFFHDSVGGRTYFSADSPDVACHEMGHAVLDAVRPELFDAQTIEAPAFHESFGDMSAILSALQVPSFRQEVLTSTGGALNRASRLSRLAEQLGAAIRVGHPDAVDPDCLRNACNSFFYRDPQTLPPSAPASQLSSEPHSFSRLFTGGFLDALAGIVKLQGSPTPDTLQQASIDVARLLLGGIATAPVVPDYFSQIAANMLQFGETAPFNGKYRDVLKSAFVRRGVLSLASATTLGLGGPQPLRVAAVGARSPQRASGAPMIAIPAAQYGLKSSHLMVQAAAAPRQLAVSGASLQLGPLESRGSQSAAESYTEDLFQRGHVQVDSHAHKETGLLHPYAFKTHAIVEEARGLVLRRITFDCGLHQAFDRSSG